MNHFMSRFTSPARLTGPLAVGFCLLFQFHLTGAPPSDQSPSDQSEEIAKLIQTLNRKGSQEVSLEKLKACQRLSVIGPAAKSAVPALIKTLGDRTPCGQSFNGSPAFNATTSPASEAAEALQRIGPAARAATKPLVALIKGGARYEQLAAASALVQIDPPAAVRPINDLLSQNPAKNRDRLSFRVSLLSLRAQAAPITEQQVNELIQFLDDPKVEDTAAMGLAHVAKTSEKIVPLLEAKLATALKDVSSNYQKIDTYCRALGISGDEHSVAILVKAIKSTPRVVARTIVDSLGEIRSPKAVDALVDLIEIKDGEYNSPNAAQALRVLGAYGPFAKEALPKLRAKRELLQNAYRQIVDDAIEKISTAPPAVVPPNESASPHSEKKHDPEQQKLAAAKLRLAKLLLTSNKTAARMRLEEIVRDFDGTDAAREAKELLSRE